MDRIEPQHIALILADAPAWAKLGLMDRSSQMRERAAEVLGAIVADRLGKPEPVYDERQMALPIMLSAFKPWSQQSIQAAALSRIKERILDEHPIAVWRKERGLTAAQLSQQAKIEPGRLASIECEMAAPTHDELDRLSAVLRAPCALLIAPQDDSDDVGGDDLPAVSDDQ